MKQLVIFVLMVAVVVAEPAKLRRRFFGRQEVAPEAPQNGLYGPPDKPSGNGYNYPKPEYGLPEPSQQTTTTQPITEPELTQAPTYVPPPPPENEEGDLDAPTEEAESEAVEGGNENDVENAEADQLRQYKQARRLVRPLKLVDGRPAKLQRLVYYPVVSARLQATQPVVASAVPVAYFPDNGFAYSSQVFHQQNW